MIIVVPASIALTPPPADRAMRRRFRVGLRLPIMIFHGRCQPSLYVTIVGGEVAYPICFRHESAVWTNDMHIHGPGFLHGSDEFGVQGQLENCPGFGFHSKFAIIRFIRPIPQFAWTTYAPQNIGPPEPSTIGETRLDNDFAATRHRRPAILYGLFWRTPAQIDNA